MKLQATRSVFYFSLSLLMMATVPSSGRGANALLSAPVAFQPNEAPVSTQYDLIDPEYDQATSRLTWVDTFGRLWVASLDSDGMIQPPNGKGTLVDPDAMKVADLRITANGPEWIQTHEGPRIMYTKFQSGLLHIPKNARVALATPETPEGAEWTFEIVNPSEPWMAPYTSTDPGDSNPRFTCVDSHRNHYWAELYDPGSAILLPLIEKSLYAVRFVPNANAVVYTAPSPVDGLAQVFMYHTDTGVAEQMTFDVLGEKKPSSVWMWPAPEFDGDYIFFVLLTVDDATILDIYRQLGSPPVWTKIHTIHVPLSTIDSPEPFTYEGRSYIIFQVSEEADLLPSSIWLAGIDPQNELIRKVSDDSLFRWRSDPEVLITASGPYVYYNRRDPDDPDSCGVFCTEGIYRAHTGLTPQTTGVSDGPRPGPPVLLQNYPNPFNPTTTIAFVIRERARVTLSVHDVDGNLIKTLIDETMDQGSKRIAWGGTDSQGSAVASGVYFCRLRAGTETSVKKIVLLK